MISSCVFLKTLFYGLYEDENRRAYEWLLSLTGLLGNKGEKVVWNFTFIVISFIIKRLPILKAVTYQGSRLAGVMYQMNRGGGKIKGACVSYDYETSRLMATPFNFDCLNYIDYLLLTTSSLNITLFIIAFVRGCTS